MEAELKKYQQRLTEIVDKEKRKILVERLVKTCEEAVTKLFRKHEQLYTLADETTDPEALKRYLESWLNDVTVENNKVSKKAC